jgi:hypothetical protein
VTSFWDIETTRNKTEVKFRNKILIIMKDLPHK